MRSVWAWMRTWTRNDAKAQSGLRDNLLSPSCAEKGIVRLERAFIQSSDSLAAVEPELASVLDARNVDADQLTVCLRASAISSFVAEFFFSEDPLP